MEPITKITPVADKPQPVADKSQATQQQPDLISMQELSKVINVNKGTLHYYVKIGLLHPVYAAKGHGGLFLFEKEKILRRWKLIQKQKAQGVRINQIAEKIQNANY